jgi:hypothetical protein
MVDKRHRENHEHVLSRLGYNKSISGGEELKTTQITVATSLSAPVRKVMSGWLYSRISNIYLLLSTYFVSSCKLAAGMRN